MKAFSTNNRSIFIGIDVQADEKLGKVVALGESGRGRTFTLIKLDGRRPPVVEINNKVNDADIVEFETGGRKRHALVAPAANSDKILVRVCSGRGYTRRGSGSASPYWGNPVTVESGWGADGDAGRIGSWGDYLMVASPNDAIFVQPSGGGAGYVFYYRTAGQEPEVWGVEEFRTEVLGPWAESCPIESLEARIKTSEERRHSKLTAFLVAKLSERAAGSATETLRRNPRWDAERQSVVVDSVTIFRGREVKTTTVLADAQIAEEAKAAAKSLAANLPEAQVVVKTTTEAGQKLVNADATRSLRAPSHWDVQEKLEEKLLGCVTAEEARKRDLSGISIELWITGAEQARVRESRPESLEVLGLRKQIEYSYGRAELTINFVDLTPTQWLAASGNVALPDATPVTVKVVGDGWNATTAKGDLSSLPEKIRQAATESTFNAWERPFLGLPIELLEDSTPFTPEAIYGQDILTGENLVAFGSWDFSAYYGLRLYWKSKREDAHHNLGDDIEAVRNTIREKQVEANKAQRRELAATLQQQTREFSNFDGVEPGLRQQIEDRRYSSLPWEAKEVETWIAETQSILDQANAQRQAEIARLNAAEATGDLLRDLRVTVDSRYNTGHVLVIRPDGFTREPDTREGGYRGDRYATYTWRNITDEAVVVEKAHRIEGITVDLTNNTGILWGAKRLTPAQLERIDRFEAEYEVLGQIIVDPAQTRARDAIVEEIRKEILHLAPEEWGLDRVKYEEVAGPHGRKLETVDATKYVNWAKQFDLTIENREAQLVRKVLCAGGMLEFFCYQKWGQMNMSARWRPLNENEQTANTAQASSTSPAPAASTTPATTFRDTGNRWVKCNGCNIGTVRLDKAQYASFQSGQTVECTCPTCRKSGPVVK